MSFVSTQESTRGTLVHTLKGVNHLDGKMAPNYVNDQIKEIHSIERFVEGCNVQLHNIDSELLNEFDVFFQFQRLTNHRYLMTFKRYRKNGRHPKTVAWLEFHYKNGLIEVSDNILGHVLNSLYCDNY